MTIGYSQVNEVDNQIGVVSVAGDVLALIGCSSSGDLDSPAYYTRKSDITDEFGTGPLVEAAVWMLEEGIVSKLLLTRADKTTAGGYGTIDVTGVTGTSVASNHTATEPFDEYDVEIRITLGGTIATGPITYVYSLDNGRTFSQPQSLGVLNHIDLTAANVRIDLAAGTLITGDVIKVRTTAPKWNGTQITSAITALKNTVLPWHLGYIVGPITASDFDTLSTAATGLKGAGKYKRLLGNVRSPTIGETESAYLTSLSTAFSAKASTRIVLGAGYARITSPIGRNEYRRPVMQAIAARLISIAAGTDAARVADGPLPSSVSITDDFGNPDEHDERINPGLDDLRFSTLATRIDRPGVYVGNARLFSTPGSDFVYAQHGRVVDKACDLTFRRLELYSSDDVQVSLTTGKILESEAKDIESNVLGDLETGLLDPRYVSGVGFTLSRDNNLLSTFRLDGAVRVTPKGYIKAFVVDLGLFNPANNTTAEVG